MTMVYGFMSYLNHIDYMFKVNKLVFGNYGTSIYC